jgi:hypothetical protein
MGRTSIAFPIALRAVSQASKALKHGENVPKIWQKSAQKAP